ncbi:MAG: hypothetical protein IJH84_03110, partial [Saccharopolyspora sp.]
ELVEAVEREWYAPAGRVATATAAPDAALRTVLAGLRQQHPMSWRDRLLPRSLLSDTPLRRS